jgi:ABC-type sugar transport system permease subunit
VKEKEKTKSARRGLTMAGKNAISGYLFILPFVLGFVVFMAYPLVQSLRMAFSYVSVDVPNNQFALDWTGLDNLSHSFTVNPDFNRAMLEELLQMVLMVPAVLIFSLFVAILLNRKFPGRGFVRAVFFLPVILASGVLVGIETNNSLLAMVGEQIQEANAMRANVTGVIEELLMGAWGGGTAALGGIIEYVLMVINQIYNIAMASGIQILIFLAGLQTINPSIFEAASIEGATGWENFWKITLPMISPMILVVVVYTVIDYLMRTDNEVMVMIENANNSMIFGRGSAMAWAYFAVAALILGLLSLGISRLVYYYD